MKSSLYFAIYYTLIPMWLYSEELGIYVNCIICLICFLFALHSVRLYVLKSVNKTVTNILIDRVMNYKITEEQYHILRRKYL